MACYEKCFGMQTPLKVYFGDGTCIVVWTSHDELCRLGSPDELGHKCLICKDDYLCFELSRSRDFCLGREIHVA